MRAVKAVERAAHAVAGQIFADLDVEAVALEFVGDVARVVDRLLERRFGIGIFGVADDQRKPVAGGDCGDRSAATQKRSRSQAMRGEFSYDGSPANKAPIPACASATLLYANRIIKPGSQPVNCLRIARLISRQLTATRTGASSQGANSRPSRLRTPSASHLAVVRGCV